ncbi:hypothetical protein C7M84_010575 [Penaeus vannamei]|uniref:Uncharacterized protein n=1 Tax=Penaeus vannamei TaxID=6689 RepID=A0A3R7M2F7_PENVA|nr:hypothetical protein C7M84_010575 [Penaeus vannamei]
MRMEYKKTPYPSSLSLFSPLPLKSPTLLSSLLSFPPSFPFILVPLHTPFRNFLSSLSLCLPTSHSIPFTLLPPYLPLPLLPSPPLPAFPHSYLPPPLLYSLPPNPSTNDPPYPSPPHQPPPLCPVSSAPTSCTLFLSPFLPVLSPLSFSSLPILPPSPPILPRPSLDCTHNPLPFPTSFPPLCLPLPFLLFSYFLAFSLLPIPPLLPFSACSGVFLFPLPSAASLLSPFFPLSASPSSSLPSFSPLRSFLPPLPSPLPTSSLPFPLSSFLPSVLLSATPFPSLPFLRFALLITPSSLSLPPSLLLPSLTSALPLAPLPSPPLPSCLFPPSLLTSFPPFPSPPLLSSLSHSLPERAIAPALSYRLVPLPPRTSLDFLTWPD